MKYSFNTASTEKGKAHFHIQQLTWLSQICFVSGYS